MYGIFTYIYHKHQLNVGKYTIHGSYGLEATISILHTSWPLGHPKKLFSESPYLKTNVQAIKGPRVLGWSSAIKWPKSLYTVYINEKSAWMMIPGVSAIFFSESVSTFKNPHVFVGGYKKWSFTHFLSRGMGPIGGTKKIQELTVVAFLKRQTI